MWQLRKFWLSFGGWQINTDRQPGKANERNEEWFLKLHLVSFSFRRSSTPPVAFTRQPRGGQEENGKRRDLISYHFHLGPARDDTTPAYLSGGNLLNCDLLRLLPSHNLVLSFLGGEQILRHFHWFLFPGHHSPRDRGDLSDIFFELKSGVIRTNHRETKRFCCC